MTPSRSLVLLLLLSSLTYTAYGQKKKLEQVKGVWIVSNDITPMQARENAIQQAKLEALRLAGAPELVSESNQMYKVEKTGRMNEIFNSLTSTTISGEVSEFKIVKENKKLNESGNIEYEVWIDVTVQLHSASPDQGFYLDVKGIREGYSSPDQLSFGATPSKEGYLTIFILGEKESAQLYPNNTERQEKLMPRTPYFFPRSKAVEYEVSTEGSLEVNYLVLLYTKEDIPFMKEPTDQNILSFIAHIDPSMRWVKSYSLLIKKQ